MDESMDPIDKLRGKVKAVLEKLVPSNVKVQEHPGRFDLDELQRLGADAPSCRLAVLSFKDAGVSGRPYDDVEFCAYIVTKALQGKAADAVNLFLGSFLKGRLWHAWPRVDGMQRPQKLAYQNLFTGDVARAGAALGAVTWTQRCESPVFDANSIAPFTELFTTYELGDVTVTDDIQLPGASE